MVDMTIPGIGRDPMALREISYATGVNILTCTGWYVAASHPAIVKKKSLEDLSDIMVKELTEGIGDTGIKAGLIGECALSYPIDPNEKKVIRAAAQAQAKVGCALTIHPSLFDLEQKKVVKNAADIIDIIQKEGANLEKFYMSHMDITCDDLEYHKKVMDTYGIVLAYDTFGQSEMYFDGLYPGAGSIDRSNERHRGALQGWIRETTHYVSGCLHEDTTCEVWRLRLRTYLEAHHS